MVMIPVNGWLRSRIRKIADDAEIAQKNNAVRMVNLGRAKRPKLTKMSVIQNTSTIKNGVGMTFPDWAKRIRVCPRSIPI